VQWTDKSDKSVTLALAVCELGHRFIRHRRRRNK